MSWEVTWNSETYKEKYKDFRDMLADSNLSDDEKAELHESYGSDCGEVQEETQNLCRELQDELDAYKEMKEMSRDDIKLLQRATGIPRSQREGLRGPNTFAQYFEYIQKHPSLRDLPLEQFVSEFNTYEDKFNSQNDIEKRKQVQRNLGIDDDWAYGSQTFWAIYENISSPKQDTQEQAELPETRVEVAEVPEVVEEIKEVIPAELETPDTPAIPKEPIEVNQIDAAEAGVVRQEDISENLWEENELSPEELKAKLIEESQGTHRVLIKMLQQSVWAGDDGVYWNGSATKSIEKHPDVGSFEELMEREWIPLESDGLLTDLNSSMSEKQKVFREQYWEFVSILESNFNLPSWIIEAIIAQETHYWSIQVAWKPPLTSHSGCKGMMQLSGVSMDDMDTAHRWNIRNYRESLQNMEFDRLLSVTINNGESTIWESIPAPIIEHLRILNNPDTSNSQHNNSMNVIQDFIKWDSTYFNHAVNMIIWAVYLSGTYHDSKTWWWDITKTADHYNAAAWERAKYRANVTGFYEAIQADWYYSQAMS